MTLQNDTPYAAAMVPTTAVDGRLQATFVIKATHTETDGRWCPATEQEPVLFSDEHVGEPGTSPIRVPSDLADQKPQAEVLVAFPKPLPPLPQTTSFGLFGAGIARQTMNLLDLGAVLRGESRRRRFAGTYDAAWQQQRMPLLPLDFDARYHMAAAPEQWLPKPLLGGEPIRVDGLELRGSWTFTVPKERLLVSANRRGERTVHAAVLDTILIWAGLRRVSCVYRCSLPLRREIRELHGAAIGRVLPSTAAELLRERR